MKFLVIGDVVGTSGVNALEKHVPSIIEKENIDFVIINGENSTGGRGIKDKELNKIYSVGANVVTMGNHIYYRKEARELYKNEERLLIPANVTNLEGKGVVTVNKNGVKVKFIGDRVSLKKEIVDVIQKGEQETSNNDKLTLQIAFL